MSRKSILFILLPVALLIFAAYGKCANVQGNVYLQGQTAHDGVTINLELQRLVPALSAGGGFIALFIVAFLLRKRRVLSAVIILIITTAGSALIINADPEYTTQTNPDGSYLITNVAAGRYKLTAQKDCFVSSVVEGIRVDQDDVNVDDVTLSDLNAYNESLLPGDLKKIHTAESTYYKRSNPHTYTGDLACLVSGNGACGWDFLPADFSDNIVDGYQFASAVNTPVAGSSSCWSTTAYPVTYQCTGNLSYYISEIACPGEIVQAADIGGGPGDETLAYICPGDRSQNVYESMKSLIKAEADYNDNSSPHTYTGSLACLASGNGAGGVPFICGDFADGVVCNYNFQMSAGKATRDEYWSWSCTAWPISYGGDSTLTFYVDETTVVRGADIGGVPGDVSLPQLCDFEDDFLRACNNLDKIRDAERDYNNNSQPHTFTGSLACLTSGNGAGGVSLLKPTLADGLECDYNYSLQAGTPAGDESIWTWSCTAWPVAYSSETAMTFYIDETGTTRAEDVGGNPGTIAMPTYICGDRDKEGTGILMLKQIAAAETDYNNNSQPHTYTGSLACLASGNGAGGMGFINPALDDGVGFYYNYGLEGGTPDPSDGSIWTWSCTAWPISYQSDCCSTFYIDETVVVRGSDLGGAPGDHTLPTID